MDAERHEDKMHFPNSATRTLAVLVGAILLASPSMALDRGKLQQFFSAPYSVGERDGELPIWPIFKKTSARDELVAYVFEYTDFAPELNPPGQRVDRLVAIRPSGEFLEVLVVGAEKPGILNWLRSRPTFDFIRQDQAVPTASPDSPQNAIELSRDYVRDRLRLATEDRTRNVLEFAK